jgi:plasmid stability protein
MDDSKTEVIFVRCLPDVKQSFAARAKRNGRSVSDVLRELVTAWGEGRVTITPHK